MNILNMLGKIAGGPWTAGDYSQYIGVKIWPKKRRPINTSLALVWWNRQTHLPSTNNANHDGISTKNKDKHDP